MTLEESPDGGRVTYVFTPAYSSIVPRASPVWWTVRRQHSVGGPARTVDMVGAELPGTQLRCCLKYVARQVVAASRVREIAPIWSHVSIGAELLGGSRGYLRVQLSTSIGSASLPHSSLVAHNRKNGYLSTRVQPDPRLCPKNIE